MSSIGRIIKEQRSILGMSRAELARTICSEKYVYLIEKGERTPSANLISQLGDKLGIDLFEYYEYLDCINPKEVLDNMKCFNMYRRKNDMLSLKKVTDTAIQLPDFTKKPWIYEIKLNNIAYIAFENKQYEEAINEINEMIVELDPIYLKSANAANLYALLSTCYQIVGDADSAKDAAMSAYNIVQNILGIRKYEQIITTVKLNVVTMHYISGDYDKAVSHAYELLNYQYEVNQYERIHVTCFFLAFSLYEKGLYEQSFEFFKRGIYLVMVDYKPNDVYFISMQDIFMEMLNDKNINSELAMDFRKKYKVGLN